MPKEEFKQEVERELIGQEREPWEVKFQNYTRAAAGG
jgi:hypothetical protein